ncbi:MAG: MarR family transcriptional regulator [Deltaproteobacteria bacterium]|nr:MarR family transcriptional regulator [Deltaproteobacteria bacterium]RLB30537.1 MAG: MarR family transcriptional regulator [Deltaproteobacteria bacterium]
MATENEGGRKGGKREHYDKNTRGIIFSIRRLMQARELYKKELNKKYQISASQLNCLISLYENGPLPPSQIAKHMLVESSTVTGVVDRLERKGFVIRTRSSSDRRVITVQLTPEGEAMAKSAPPPIQQKILDGLSALSDEETASIAHALRTLTSMLDVQDLNVEKA